MKNFKNAEFKNNKSYLLLFLKIHLFKKKNSSIHSHAFIHSDSYLSIYHVSGTAIDAGVIAVTKPKNPFLHKAYNGRRLIHAKETERY